MIDIEKLAGRFPVFLPVLHFASCGLYMAGYSTTFGSNIGGLFSASDFFTITIQHLIMTYAVGLGLPLLAILARHRSGKTYAADLIAREDDPVKKAAMTDNREKTVRFISRVLPTFALVPLALLACQFWAGALREYYLSLNIVLLAAMPMLWTAATRLGFYGLRVELTWVLLAFAVGVFGLGLNAGERDRRLPFSAFVSSAMQCKKHVILIPIGDRFISATSDQRRHLIDDKCEVQFTFPKSDIAPSKSLYDLMKAKLFAKDAAQAPARADTKAASKVPPHGKVAPAVPVQPAGSVNK